VSPGFTLIDTGDLNGDGMIDVILYDPTNGYAATGLSTGTGFNFTAWNGYYSPEFTSVKLGYYTGHTTADLTLYNAHTATGYFGTGTGTGAFNFQSLFWSPGYDTVSPKT